MFVLIMTKENLFFIPENIDIDKILRLNPIGQVAGFHKDNLYYILHLLSDIPSRNKDLTNEEGYVPINAEILKEWIGKGYRQYLNYLEDAGVIEVDYQFIVGKKSNGYRLCEKYQSKLTPIPVTKTSLLKRLSTSQSNEGIIDKQNGSDIPIEIYSAYDPVKKWYNTGGLTINYELAHSYNELTYQSKKDNKSKWDVPPNGSEFERKNPYLQYAGNSLSIEKIRKSNFNPHFDMNVFRYHSVLTNCKREIRNFIRYDGHELVAIDLSNSQPTLLTLLLDHEFWESIGEEGKLNILDIPYIDIDSIFNKQSHYTNTITLGKKAQNNRIVEGSEIYDYYRMVGSGKFYSEFRQLLKDRLKLHFETNDEVKPMMFIVLFTDNRFIGQPEAEPKRIFKELFPTVYEITSLIKKNAANNLPILLQRIESYIMYHRIVPRITKESPDLPIFTLHDSIVTLKGHEDYVENVMKEEFGKCLGFPPHFKKEYWKEANLGLVA